MAKKRPDFIANTVVGEGENQRWREIGAGFASSKGSVTVLLDAVPVSGKLILIRPKERPQATPAQ